MAPTVVYTCGAFDLFHVGHLRMLKGARAFGDRLIVGVSTDELCSKNKGITTTVPFEERLDIVNNIKGVDMAIPQTCVDKVDAWERIGFDVWVVGDDWFEVERYQGYRRELTERGVRCVFLPYTANVSSTQRRVTSVS